MSGMAGRLDRQKQPGRFHKLHKQRPYRRGYTTVPHPTWGDLSGPVGAAGIISVSRISPATFAAVGGAGVFVITGTGFTGAPTVNFCGTAVTGANVVVNSATQITVTTPSLSGFASKAGTTQPVYVTIAGLQSNTVGIVVTAS